VCHGGALYLITTTKKPFATLVCSEAVRGDFFHVQHLNTLVIVNDKLVSVEVAVTLWQILDNEHRASARSLAFVSLMYPAALELIQIKLVSHLISLVKLCLPSPAGFWDQASAYRGLF